MIDLRLHPGRFAELPVVPFRTSFGLELRSPHLLCLSKAQAWFDWSFWLPPSPAATCSTKALRLLLVWIQAMEKPSRYRRAFNNDMPMKASVTQPHDPLWDLEVVDDWPYNVAKNLRSMAIDLGRAAQLPFTPNLKPFGGGRALFFCYSLSQLRRF